MKDSINMNDFQTVTRFENLGGGWGYSGQSVEAIRFMADTDVVLSKCLLPSKHLSMCFASIC